MEMDESMESIFNGVLYSHPSNRDDAAADLYGEHH